MVDKYLVAARPSGTYSLLAFVRVMSHLVKVEYLELAGFSGKYQYFLQ